MNAKLSDFSEISKLLSVKSRVDTDICTLFGKFGLGRVLRRLSLEKRQGVPAVTLIIALCLFRLHGKTIHSIYRNQFYGLLGTGKNCYYRLMSRAPMDWRRLMNYMVVRFVCILRRQKAECDGRDACLIIDDTTIEKTGVHMENISRVHDHVSGRCVLGFKVLLCAFFDGISTLPFDFSIHREEGRKKDCGLTESQRRGRFSLRRRKGNPDHERAEECGMPKTEVAMRMIARAAECGLNARYVLCDSWFTSEAIMRFVRGLRGGAMHLVGLAKMDGTRYLVRGKWHRASELVALYERTESRLCRKYKCRYIQMSGTRGGQDVRIYLVRYGRNQSWNAMLSTDTSMSFVRAFELYQIRWNIEVLNKETKQYLGLGKCQARDFNAQIADATLCYMTYTVMALDKRFSEYQTMGELFAAKEGDLYALTLWQRVLGCIKRLLDVLAEVVGLSVAQLVAAVMGDERIARQYEVMANALIDSGMQEYNR